MKDWKKLVIQEGETIKGVMSLFEKNRAQIAIVASQDNILMGTITDGDIRRGILKNIDLNDNVQKVINNNPVTVFQSTPSQEIFKKAIALDLKYIPVINEKRELKGVYSKDDLLSITSRDNPVVIMAGGEGIRLRPITNTIPKPLVDLNGSPIIERLLVHLINQGFKNFYLSINYLGDMIESYFGDGKKWGVNISYLKEDKKLGTAGSLKLLEKEKIDKNIIILNGDLVTSVNFGELLDYHVNDDADATVGIQKIWLKVPYGVINHEDRHVSSLEEKPLVPYCINCGIYVLSPKTISEIQTDKKIDMTCLIAQLLNHKKKVMVFPIYENWQDIGNIRDLEAVREIFGGR